LPFESLAYRHRFTVADFPPRWLPLFSLYDPDLPLLPIAYFHLLTPGLTSGRPSYDHRIFGYIERMNLEEHGLDVYVVCSKNLGADAAHRGAVERRVRNMLGVEFPVTLQDVATAFTGQLDYANGVLVELWHRVIETSYGGKLPFGASWDAVFGLARFVASWNSPSGRKGELIQTHYFASRFGERIQSAGGMPQNDFYLLPTFEEITDPSNPLGIFPKFARLVDGARAFVGRFGRPLSVGRLTLSAFGNPGKVRFDHTQLELLANALSQPQRIAITEAFNAFDKGPPRTVIFLLMLADLADRRLDPSALTAADIGQLYDQSGGSYQSPKVISLYAQQCFGNASAIPIDLWVKTFFSYPLAVAPVRGGSVASILANSVNLGRVERLFWITAQARKVHSSACNDAVWCAKYNSEGESRGANPLACKICVLRATCPAYHSIATALVSFNGASPAGQFVIRTSAGNNTTPNQRLVSAEGSGKYGKVMDDFSPVDEPDGYVPFPAHKALGLITVREFVSTY
jgi:hypothetical protein